MKYITLFEQQTAFDNAKSTLDKPNMSLVTETGNVYSLSVGGGGNANGHPYVDLGLSVKWATCNVGASSETDYGYYFQWGDTVDKSNADCSWSTYKHCNGNEFLLKKYCTNSDYGTVDNKTTLDPEDDAARVIMGGDWRMPTKADFYELLDNTDSEWTQVNGVNGRRFTSTINGKSIFIPASGRRSGSSFVYRGDYGSIWSSSLYDDSFTMSAWDFNIGSDNSGAIGNDRYNGFAVRGVL